MIDEVVKKHGCALALMLEVLGSILAPNEIKFSESEHASSASLAGFYCTAAVG